MEGVSRDERHGSRDESLAGGLKGLKKQVSPFRTGRVYDQITENLYHLSPII